MLQSLFSHTASLIPQSALGHLGWLRSAVGAFLGIGIAGVSAMLLLGGDSAALPWLVAPMGASAVLVFAVPASPLAQPWPVIGGNLISGATGIAAGMLTGSPLLAASLGVGAAIAVMTVSRSLHPPGGACALLCALGAAGPESWGWIYMLPIAANVLMLALAGWLYNGLTGHSWPHRLEVPRPAAEEAITRDMVEDVLAEWDEMIDIDVDDLLALVHAAERKRSKARPAAGRVKP